jgi:hypothetical protein
MIRAEQVIAALDQHDGSSDRQLSEVIFGTRRRSTQINGECRYLANRGLIVRKKWDGEPIRNFLVRPKPKLKLVWPGWSRPSTI